MNVTYDPRTDTLSVTLKENAKVVESDEGKPGVILDYDGEGDLVSLEMDASTEILAIKRLYERAHRAETVK